MKICKKCGYTADDNSIFCVKCASQDFACSIEKPMPAASLIKAMFYVLLYFFTALAVRFTYTFYYMSKLASGNWNYRASELFALTEKHINEHSAALSAACRIIFLALVAAFFILRKKSIKNELRIKPFPAKLIPAFVILGVSANVIITFIISAVLQSGLIANNAVLNQSAAVLEPGDILLMIFSTCILTSITEEILFRSLIITRLKCSFGPFLCTFVSSIIFAAAHQTPIAMTYTFIMGIIFAFVFLKFDSVLPSVICHAFFNLTALFYSQMNVQLLINALLLFSFASFIVTLYILTSYDKKEISE